MGVNNRLCGLTQGQGASEEKLAKMGGYCKGPNGARNPKICAIVQAPAP